MYDELNIILGFDSKLFILSEIIANLIKNLFQRSVLYVTF